MKIYKLLANTPIHSLFLTDSPKKHRGSIKHTTVLHIFEDIKHTEITTIIFEKQLEISSGYVFIHYLYDNKDYILVVQPLFLEKI